MLIYFYGYLHDTTAFRDSQEFILHSDHLEIVAATDRRIMELEAEVKRLVARVLQLKDACWSTIHTIDSIMAVGGGRCETKMSDDDFLDLILGELRELWKIADLAIGEQKSSVSTCQQPEPLQSGQGVQALEGKIGEGRERSQ